MYIFFLYNNASACTTIQMVLKSEKQMIFLDDYKNWNFFKLFNKKKHVNLACDNYEQSAKVYTSVS